MVGAVVAVVSLIGAVVADVVVADGAAVANKKCSTLVLSS